MALIYIAPCGVHPPQPERAFFFLIPLRALLFFFGWIQNYFELDSGICIDTVLTLLLFLADMHFNGCSQALSGKTGGAVRLIISQ